MTNAVKILIVLWSCAGTNTSCPAYLSERHTDWQRPHKIAAHARQPSKFLVIHGPLGQP